MAEQNGERKMACVNACSDKQRCFMLKPYYTRGHVMCFKSGMAISWCIQCGCNARNKVLFCHAVNELLVDDEKEPAKQ